MQIWDRIRLVRYQIPAPIRTLFYSKPESGVHVTEMIICDLFLFNLPLATTPAIIIATTSANSSSTSLSATFIFGARNFHSRRIWYEKPAPKTGARKWSRFMGRRFTSPKVHWSEGSLVRISQWPYGRVHMKSCSMFPYF